MNRLIVAVLMAFLAAGLTGCGDDNEGDDDVTLPDGGPDAGPDAAVTGTVADFDECAADDDCAGAGSDCRMVGWTASKQCLPACESTDQCGFNTYCYPENSSSVLGTQFAFMAGHCWFSICGPGRQNGETGGACKMGKEASIPVGEQLDGFCIAIEDGLFGQCLEAGDVAAGGACDLADPTRDGANCNSTSLCAGQTGAAQGTCQQVCDPRKILTGEDDCTVATEDCFDQSSMNTYADGSTARSTLGFCSGDIQACAIVGPSTCPSGEGCAFTNPVRETGVCDPAAAGSVALGAACGGTPAGDATECGAGAACLGTCFSLCDGPATRPGQLGGTCTVTTDCKQLNNTCVAGICEQACGGAMDFACPAPTTCVNQKCTAPATHTIDCNGLTAGTRCQPLRWDNGFDMTANTADDVFAADWGVCDTP